MILNCNEKSINSVENKKEQGNYVCIITVADPGGGAKGVHPPPNFVGQHIM